MLSNLQQLQTSARRKVHRFLARYPHDYEDLMLVRAPARLFAVTVRINGRARTMSLFNIAREIEDGMAGPHAHAYAAQINFLEREVYSRLTMAWPTADVLAAVAESVGGPPVRSAPKKHVTFAPEPEPVQPSPPSPAPRRAVQPPHVDVPMRPPTPPKPAPVPRPPLKRPKQKRAPSPSPEYTVTVDLDLDAPLDFDDLDRHIAETLADA